MSRHIVLTLKILFSQDNSSAIYDVYDPAIRFVDPDVVWAKAAADEERVLTTLDPNNGFTSVGAEDGDGRGKFKGIIFFSGDDVLTDDSQIEFFHLFDITDGHGPTRNFVEWLGRSSNRIHLAESRPNFKRGSLSHQHRGWYFGK